MENKLVVATGQGPWIAQGSSFVVMGQLCIIILVVVTQINKWIKQHRTIHTLTHTQ